MALAETRWRGVAVAVRLLALVAGISTFAGQTPHAVSQPAQPDGPNSSRAEPSRTANTDQAVVKLTPNQQKQIGLETAVVEAAPQPEQFRAYGAVLDISRITELTNSYANAQAQLQTAQARLEVAKSAFDRTRNLVESAALPKKEAETAEGIFRTDKAALAAA